MRRGGFDRRVVFMEIHFVSVDKKPRLWYNNKYIYLLF